MLRNFFPIISSTLLLAAPLISAEPNLQAAKSKAALEYQAKDYSYLFGMQGFSDAQLKMHFQLYQGYVKNTNLLLMRMKELELQDRDQTYDYGALKRRLGWEFDGMRLHEFYLGNLGGHEDAR